MVVKERLTFDDGALLLENYGYEVWCNGEKLYWYNAQPHLDDATLAVTDPHHKHISPDIKHHRVPAPGLSFTRPNLPVLIQEVERLMAGS